MPAIRILVVDGERAVAQAVAFALTRAEGFDVVGVAASAGDAVRIARASHPSIAVVDDETDPGLDGLMSALRDAVSDVDFIVMASRADGRRAYAAVSAGAVGFVSKNAPIDEMVAAIRGAVIGETWIAPRLLTDVLRSFVGQDEAEDERIRRLSDRERQVLRCMTAGYDRVRIARELVLSVNTVRTHTQNILAKLEVHSSLEAVSVARQSGMLSGRARSDRVLGERDLESRRLSSAPAHSAAS
jgi:DNA-binding NarL/FixJ family response regulator